MCSQLNLGPAGLLVVGLIAAGCSAGDAEVSRSAGEPVQAGAPAPSAARQPFLFKEAGLPKGFPSPGPVEQIIVKEYPAYRLARVRSGPQGVPGGPNAMFSPLFQHIKRNEIAMTAPVEIGYSARPVLPDLAERRGADSMAFLYGEPTWGQAGTDEADPRVIVEDVPAMKVVSIGVRGDYTDARFAKTIARLNAWIEAKGSEVRVVGPPRYLGYNSPFVPAFLRYGEVQLPIGESPSPVKPPSSRPRD